MARGRKPKEVLSLDDQIAALIEKMYIPQLNEDGEVVFVRNTVPLTLEETALAIWLREGRKTAKPMSAMAVLKIQNRALEKLKAEFKTRFGVDDITDVINMAASV